MKKNIFGGILSMCFTEETFEPVSEELYNHFPQLYCLFFLNKMQSYKDLTFNFSFIKRLSLSVLYCKEKHVSGA